MPRFRLLITPLARGAYFRDTLEVARAELHAHGFESEPVSIGTLNFLDIDKIADGTEAGRVLTRLSVAQAIFEVDGNTLRPLNHRPEFLLPPDLVFGAKYPGKTHEIVTQLAINLALRHAIRDVKTLIDPMAGRGTTLLWALRYGLNARGIEKDPQALDAFHAHVKKQTKLHRLKHQHDAGFIGKKGHGRFIRYTFGEHSAQLIHGDSRDAETLMGRQRFDTLVTDLPYGIRFDVGALQSLTAAWIKRIQPGGTMVLIFNRYRPKRKNLIEWIEGNGMEIQPFEAPHRMSEAIVRDLVVFRKHDAG